MKTLIALRAAKHLIRRSLPALGGVLLAACASTPQAPTGTAGSPTQHERGRRALQEMAGCYIVDYSYVETEALKKGYRLDRRVYDVNKTKTVKEWIEAEEVTPDRIRLQHVLFFTDARGRLVEGSELKHHAEDWEYAASHWYDYEGANRWSAKPLSADQPAWLRRITNLDDGLRYQCAAAWTGDANPEWSCNNYAPIPGRETRDMKRTDYQALDRGTRLIVYGESWLERQENVKTVHTAARREPLAKELGKNWYVRVPDRECAAIREWAAPQWAFWKLLRETWDQELTGGEAVEETMPAGEPPRFVKMGVVEAKYRNQDLTNPGIREKARAEIREVIAAYKKPSLKSSTASTTSSSDVTR